jgi:transcription termination/antitermination protein NusG
VAAAGWFALHVRSNCEHRVARFLAARRGPETFLPSYRAKVRRGTALRIVDRPLFSGYVFVRVAESREDRIKALQASGVVGFVGFGGRPVPVDDRTMESLRILVGGSREVRPHPMLREGQIVRVVDGPFLGAIGRLSRARGRKPCLVVTLEILGRAAAAPVDLKDVEPVV